MRLDFLNVRMMVNDQTLLSDDPMEIIKPVGYSANIYEGEVAYNVSLRNFSKSQRLLHALLWYGAEVDNGGHHQFYSNSTGLVWRDALEGLQQIRATAAAKVLTQSARCLWSSPSLDHDERNRQLNKQNLDFSSIDLAYYSCSELICSQSVNYARQRPTDFYFEGVVTVPNTN
jgi:Domain of unknown function (DUF4375)